MMGNYYSGQPALVSHKVGLGTAYYFGAGFSPQTAQTFLEKLHFAEPYHKLIEIPKEAELAIRSTLSQQYLFVLNYMAYPIEVTLHKPMTNLFTHSLVEGKLSLEPYGVLILENKLCK